MKVTIYIAASLDGFIAARDGDVGWLKLYENTAGKEDYGYGLFFSSIDGIIIGSRTYEQIQNFDNPEWLYSSTPCVVFTSRKLETKTTPEEVMFVSGTPGIVLSNLEKQGLNQLWLMGGGQLIATFLEKGLVDELILTTIPIILGTGIRLISGKIPSAQWAIHGVRTYENGVVQIHYVRSSSSQLQ